ncbi:hypothetical protein [Cellulomonas dongxiuzhuiae]|uniref:Uncharacterized protein n=1 Tax=Cellulomonas dongxiuzhuiae TaxID=2819979 RepID=A0ABX8GNJ3_9CELL|nr:hypothetical protein [Cellulomonas dongxiuzhuiae]MBO3095850.1 hypothetical protein [Cellulomonas dongxiuzhuiae]QWC17156.1 hypothetical protein KKR89_06020 [Cellulomonas dongxiuzhuiae]
MKTHRQHPRSSPRAAHLSPRDRHLSTYGDTYGRERIAGAEPAVAHSRATHAAAKASPWQHDDAPTIRLAEARECEQLLSGRVLVGPLVGLRP